MRKTYYILEGCSNKYDNTRIQVLWYMLYATYQKLYNEDYLENFNFFQFSLNILEIIDTRLNIPVFNLEYNMALRMSSIKIKLMILKSKFLRMILHAKLTRKGSA